MNAMKSFAIIISKQTVGYGDILISNSTTQRFVIVYILVSTILLAGTIHLLNATLEEIEQLDRFKEKLCLMSELEVGLLADRDTCRTKQQVVLQILCLIDILNHERDVQPWIQVNTV
jgi:Na+-transporting NADH:ubiquinone oxidoreductase subunit NqrC